MDLASRNAPLPISRKALPGMGAMVGIAHVGVVTHRIVRISDGVSDRGHTTFGLHARNTGFVRVQCDWAIYANPEEADVPNEWPAWVGVGGWWWLKKAHLQLGRPFANWKQYLNRLPSRQRIREISGALNMRTCHRAGERRKKPRLYRID